MPLNHKTKSQETHIKLARNNLEQHWHTLEKVIFKHVGHFRVRPFMNSWNTLIVMSSLETFVRTYTSVPSEDGLSPLKYTNVLFIHGSPLQYTDLICGQSKPIHHPGWPLHNLFHIKLVENETSSHTSSYNWLQDKTLQGVIIPVVTAQKT